MQAPALLCYEFASPHSASTLNTAISFPVSATPNMPNLFPRNAVANVPCTMNDTQRGLLDNSFSSCAPTAPVRRRPERESPLPLPVPPPPQPPLSLSPCPCPCPYRASSPRACLL